MRLFRHVGKPRHEIGAPRLLTPPPGATVGKRWRFRRNLVIYVAFKNGFSQRVLADVFDLPRSRISAIIKEISVVDDPPACCGRDVL